MNATIGARPLAASDRCDRCGAQAYVRATMASGFDLLLCAHHFRENEDRLRAIAAAIEDESDRLADVPATASLEER
jgi:ribosomal protein S14